MGLWVVAEEIDRGQDHVLVLSRVSSRDCYLFLPRHMSRASLDSRVQGGGCQDGESQSLIGVRGMRFGG